MASQFNSTNSPLPQGFSVYQPALGAQLQFFPALGTSELDDMMHAYVSGPASIKEKRASISLDFLEHVQLTGQTFKFYPVYAVSPITPSPVTSVSSSFNVSPVNSTWDWNQASASTSVSSRSSTQSRKNSKAGNSSTRHSTVDFSHLPGMKIMTKDGQDVTNSASRGSKTKEQRDHAHLMRVLKACDSCRKKKIRCDPSHKKRPAPQAPSQLAAKPAKKARTAPQKPSAARTPPVDDALRISASPLGLDPTFTFSDLHDLEINTEVQHCEPWEEFVQYPTVDENYDFFHDPEGYLSSQSSASSSSASPVKSLTPNSQESMVIPGLEPESQTTSPELPFLDQSGPLNDYTDFNLFSPSSSFSEDERMVLISSTRILSPSQPSQSESPTAVYGNVDSEGGVTDWSEWSTSVSPLGTGVIAESHMPLDWLHPNRSPGESPSHDSNVGSNPMSSTEAPGQVYISCPPGGTVAVMLPYGTGVDCAIDAVTPSTSVNSGPVTIDVGSGTPVQDIAQPSSDEYIHRSESPGEGASRSLSDATNANVAHHITDYSPGRVQSTVMEETQDHYRGITTISDNQEASSDARSTANVSQGELLVTTPLQSRLSSVGVLRHSVVDTTEPSGGRVTMAHQTLQTLQTLPTSTDNRNVTAHQSLVATDTLQTLSTSSSTHEGSSSSQVTRFTARKTTTNTTTTTDSSSSLVEHSTSSIRLAGVDMVTRAKAELLSESQLTSITAPMMATVASIVTVAVAWILSVATSGPSFVFASVSLALGLRAIVQHAASTLASTMQANVCSSLPSSARDTKVSSLRTQTREESSNLLVNLLSVLRRKASRFFSSRRTTSSPLFYNQGVKATHLQWQMA